MFGKHLFQLACRQSVAGNINHIIGARHDVEISVLILVTGITGFVIAGEGGQIFLNKGRIGTPYRWQAGWRQWQFDGNGAKLIRRPHGAILGKDIDLIARHRDRGRAKLYRQRFNADRIGADRPAGLGLPPVVDHRHTKLVLRPDDGVRVCALTGQEQMLQRRGVILFQEFAVRVGTFYRPESGWRGEQHLDPMIPDHPPEHPGIRGADGLALEQYGRTSRDQRRVDDIGMPDHPADVRRRPIDVTRIDVIDVRHRPLQRHRMPAIVAHHALWLAGRPGSVEDIKRVRGLDRHRRHLINALMRRVPFHITPVDKIGHQRLALIDHAGIRFVGGQLDRFIQKRLVGDNAVRFMPAGRADDGLWRGIIDPLGKFGGGKPAKDNRMHRAKTRASQHRHHRLGDHRHIDDDPVTGTDTKPPQHAGEPRRGGLQLGIGQRARIAGDRRVVDDRLLLASSGGDMPVDSIVTGVHLAIGKPAMKGWLG